MADEKSPTSDGIYPRGFSLATRWPWPLVKSEDLIHLNYGRALRDSDRLPGDTPVYGTNGQCGWHNRPLSVGPGLILGRKGQGHLGVEWCESSFWVIDTAYYVTPKTDGVDLRYIYYLLKYIGLNHLKDGTSNPGLSRSTFAKLLLPRPPMTVQRTISSILSLLDDRIALANRSNETLLAIAQSIFKSWFIDFDPIRAKISGADLEGLDAETAALFPGEFQESEYGLVPAGWRQMAVKDLYDGLFDGLHGTPAPSETGAMFLGIQNFTSTGLDFTDIRRISEKDWPKWTRRVTPTAGDIVFTYEATLGFFAVVPPGLRCCLGRRTALIRPRAQDENGLFLFHSFIAQPFQNILLARRNHGSTVDRIPLSDFPRYSILWPGLELSRRFSSTVAPLWERIHTNQAQMDNLRQIRDTLLPRLISGQIRLPEAQDAIEEVLA